MLEIRCEDEYKISIKKGTKICVLPNFDVENKTIKRAKINKKVTCDAIAKYVGLKPSQAYLIDNFNGSKYKYKI